MTGSDIALIGTSFAAGTLGGLTGFGFNVLAMPFFTLWLPPHSAVPVGALTGIAAYTALLGDTHIRRGMNRQLLALCVTPALLGLPAGLLLLSTCSARSLRLLIGITVLASGVLVWKIRTWPPARSPSVVMTVGLLSGVMSTSTSLNGPPVAALVQAQGRHAPEARATVGVFVLIVSAASSAVLIAAGKLDTVTGWLLVWLGAAALVGVLTGSRLAPRVAGAHLNMLVRLLITASGAVSIISALT